MGKSEKKNTIEYRGSFSEVAIVATLFGTTFCLFGTLQLFLTNVTEFWFSLDDIWWICVVCTIAVAALLILVGLIVPLKARLCYSAIILGISVAAYIQGNYIPMNYGSLNGAAINWSDYSHEAIRDGILWGLCIIIPIVLACGARTRECMRKIVRGLSLALIAVQVISLGVLLITTDFSAANSAKTYSLNTEGEFTLAENENTLIFVLDCYDSKVFKEFIDANNEYSTGLLADFTYYPNTVGGATRTVLAMPYILTGYAYTHGETYREYIDTGFKQADLYQALKANDYTIGIYTQPEFISESMQGSILNYTQRGVKVSSHIKLAERLLQFTACRYSPQTVKQCVWMYSDDFNDAAEQTDTYLTNDAAFYATLKEQKIVLDRNSSAFRLYHLNGAHPPYTLDAEAQRQDQTSLEQQQMGLMVILNEFFCQMKDLGIYDNANIIIMSDHGEGGIEYNPLLLIKPKGASSDHTSISNVPVSYANLHPTLMSWLGEEKSGVKSIEELQMSDNNQRTFYQQTSTENGSYAVEYRITGEVPISEQVVEVARHPIMTANRNALSWGETVYFDTRATGNPYIVTGFRGIEDHFTWTLGNEAELLIPLASLPDGDLCLKIETYMKILATQRVGVEVNEEFLNWYMLSGNELCVRIPESFIETNELRLKLHLPDAARPCDLNPASTDSSELALAVYALTIGEWNAGISETELCAAP